MGVAEMLIRNILSRIEYLSPLEREVLAKVQKEHRSNLKELVQLKKKIDAYRRRSLPTFYSSDFYFRTNKSRPFGFSVIDAIINKITENKYASVSVNPSLTIKFIQIAFEQGRLRREIKEYLIMFLGDKFRNAPVEKRDWIFKTNLQALQHLEKCFSKVSSQFLPDDEAIKKLNQIRKRLEKFKKEKHTRIEREKIRKMKEDAWRVLQEQKEQERLWQSKFCVVCGKKYYRKDLGSITDIEWGVRRKCSDCLKGNRRSTEVKYCMYCGKKMERGNETTKEWTTLSCCTQCRDK